ncbi:putative juvenile hormone acid methyltransferase [Trypoxylus dichotomus]
MNHASKWLRTTVTKEAAKDFLENYGPLLKWKSYKEDILEVGCADGSITKNILFPYIKDHVHKFLATDKLANMIDVAKKENYLEEIEYQILDVMNRKNVENMHNRFDHIFSFIVAHIIPDSRGFFTSLHKMLKPNGQIVTTALNDNFLKRSLCRQAKEERWAKYVKPDLIFANYTNKPDQYLRTLLTDIGFQVDICHVKYKTYQTEHFEELITALIEMYQDLGKFPAELREEFIEDHVQYAYNTSVYLGEPDKLSGGLLVGAGVLLNLLKSINTELRDPRPPMRYVDYYYVTMLYLCDMNLIPHDVLFITSSARQKLLIYTKWQTISSVKRDSRYMKEQVDGWANVVSTPICL